MTPNLFLALYQNIKNELFGQHIALEIISQAIIAHTNSHASPKKPLVLSFHGTPGTGKNFVSDIIVKNLYKKGFQSKYVHKFLGRSDFPLDSRVNEYKVSYFLIPYIFIFLYYKSKTFQFIYT